MTVLGKDAPEVIIFRAAFSRLKDWLGDNPDEVDQAADDDSDIRLVVMCLGLAASAIRQSEMGSAGAFAAPVDPAFIREWRDYEDRYESVVAPCYQRFHKDWDHWDSDGYQIVPALEDAWDLLKVDFLEANEELEAFFEEVEEQIIKSEDEGGSVELTPEIAQDAVENWGFLVQSAPIDVTGIIRRRLMIPFVLVPRQVALKYGPTDSLSLLTQLRQAQEAFIFGIPLAALALMRSVLETTMANHYNARGAGIAEMINSISGNMPRNVNKAQLHDLRMLANSALHPDRNSSTKIRRLDGTALEKEIARHLHGLRALVEGAQR